VLQHLILELTVQNKYGLLVLGLILMKAEFHRCFGQLDIQQLIKTFATVVGVNPSTKAVGLMERSMPIEGLLHQDKPENSILMNSRVQDPLMHLNLDNINIQHLKGPSGPFLCL
jgi:hypothetical protein